MRKLIHGEVIIKEINSVPKNAKLLNVKEYIVVGESETLGNDHRIAVLEDTLCYEKDGVLYIKNETESKVYCPSEKRHATETLPASVWEIGIAQEYDYLKQEKRNVSD